MPHITPQSGRQLMPNHIRGKVPPEKAFETPEAHEIIPYFSLYQRKHFQEGKQRFTNFLSARKGLVMCHVAEFLIALIAAWAS